MPKQKGGISEYQESVSLNASLREYEGWRMGRGKGVLWDGGGRQLSDHKEKWKISFASHDKDVKKCRGKEKLKAPQT